MSSNGTEHVLECVHERTSAEPDGNQNNTSNIWTGRTRMKADGGSSRSPLERDEVSGVIDELVERRKVIEWHGLLAPATEEHLKAIIQNEQESGAPRKLLVAKANRWLQSLRDGDGKEIATDGGLPDDSSSKCYSCDRVVDSRSVSLVPTIVHHDEGMGYDEVDLPCCRACQLERFGHECDMCGQMHMDLEGAFQCCDNRLGPVPGGETA